MGVTTRLLEIFYFKEEQPTIHSIQETATQVVLFREFERKYQQDYSVVAVTMFGFDGGDW